MGASGDGGCGTCLCENAAGHVWIETCPSSTWALMIRIGLGVTFCYNYSKEPPK